METYDVTLNRWNKIGHSPYASNENLYSYYWQKGSDVSIPSNWLENTVREFGFDCIADFLSVLDGGSEEHELVNNVVAKADNDKVSKNPFLYYMRNKSVNDVANCSTSDLLHDAYMCRELYFNNSHEKRDELLKKHPDEVIVLVDIYPAIDRELLFRLSDFVDIDMEIPSSYCYIEFLKFSSSDKLDGICLYDMYNQLYKLYCFFNSVKEPLKKKAANEYKHCKIMKDALEVSLLKRLRYSSDVGLI